MTDKPTVTQADIDRAVLQWCGEKDRETSNDDIEYFEANWRVIPGLRSRVENLAAHREAAIKEALTTILDHGYISEYIEEERHDYLIARQALAQQGSEL